MLVTMQLWNIQRRIHVSWIIAVWSLGVVIGVASVQYIQQTYFGYVVWLFVGLLLTILSLTRAKIYVLPIVLAGGFLIGVWRGSVLESNLVVYETLNGRKVQLTGKINDDPDVDKKGAITLRLNHVSIDGKQYAGKIWASINTNYELKRGDIVLLDGKIQKGFGNFIATMYQPKLNNVQRPQPGDVAGYLRDEFAEKVRLGIIDPEASLGIGYLLGQRRALPAELTQALIVTGLTHVVVASGYNLTILVRLTRRLFVNVSKYLATMSATFMIIGFMSITGASPSMSRAGLVTGISLAVWYYGRRIHPFVILPFAAAVTVLIDPSYAWNDLGWQLSFAAFGGVMILAPLLQRYFFGEKKPGNSRQIIGETVSAFIVTLPILMVSFGQFSNVAIITNLLVLPFIPLAMLLTFATGIAGLLSPALAAVVGMPASLILGYMISVVNYFSSLSWAQTSVNVGTWFMWFSYALIFMIVIYLWRKTRFDLRESNIVD